MADFLTELERCIPYLRRYARALVRDPQVADDLVQDCLERAIDRRSLWRGTGPLKSWLYVIMKNIHRNERRKYATRPTIVSVDDAHSSLATPPGQDGRAALRDVLSALDNLSDDHRDVVILAAIEGLPYSEISQVLDIPIGTVMSRLSRARDALIGAIDPESLEDTKRQR